MTARFVFCAMLLAACLVASRPAGAQDLVMEIQQTLTRLGIDAGPADGRYGPKTQSAVRQYQEERGMVPDGIIVPSLLEDMRSLGDQNRLALLFGNSSYSTVTPLENPSNDATVMAQTLRDLNFMVSIHLDSSRADMSRAVRTFRNRLQAAKRARETVGLFYYAGHAVQIGENNYLIPVDFNFELEGGVANLRTFAERSIRVSDVLGSMDDADVPFKFVILDACRDNPFAGMENVKLDVGLAQIQAPTGSLIAYATAPGAVAFDGEAGGHSPYTRALLRNVPTPGLKIEDVFKRVRSDLVNATQGGQIPWESTSLTRDFRFVPGSHEADQEAELWKQVRSSDRVEDLERYLETYPNGVFANLAQLKIEGLQAHALQASLKPEEMPGAQYVLGGRKPIPGTGATGGEIVVAGGETVEGTGKTGGGETGQTDTGTGESGEPVGTEGTGTFDVAALDGQGPESQGAKTQGTETGTDGGTVVTDQGVGGETGQEAEGQGAKTTAGETQVAGTWLGGSEGAGSEAVEGASAAEKSADELDRLLGEPALTRADLMRLVFHDALNLKEFLTLHAADREVPQGLVAEDGSSDYAELDVADDIRTLDRLNPRELSVQDGSFEPDKPVAREVFAMFMEDLLVLRTTNRHLRRQFIGQESPFEDVHRFRPSFNAVMTVSKFGMMSADAAKRFRPRATISGAEAVRALAVMSREIGGGGAPSADLSRAIGLPGTSGAGTVASP